MHTRPPRLLRPHNALLAAVALAWLPACALADDDVSHFLGDLPVVLSASRLAQPLNEIPGAVTVLDREMIRATGARSLAELLRWVPGFQVGAKNGYLPLTTYHGLSDDAPRRMLVRIDGRSAYSPYFVTGIEWNKISIDPEDIERIEVFRGSNAAAYGSQAFMGAVNIVTRAAADTPRLRVRINEGEHGIQDRSVSIGHAFGAAALRLSAAREADEGLPGVYDSYRRQRADLRVDWQLAPQHRLEIHAGMVRLNAGAGAEGNDSDPARELRSEAAFGQLRWRWQPAQDEELSLTYFQHHERMQDGFVHNSVLTYLVTQEMRGRQFASEVQRQIAQAVLTQQIRGILQTIGIAAGDGPAIVDFGNRVVRDDVEFEHRFSPHADIRLVWGAGHREDRLHGLQYFARRDALHYRSSRIFGNFEWRPHAQWLFNGAIMAEDGSYSGVLVAPRLAANYHLSPNHTLRASLSRAYRRPTPFERHSDSRFQEAVSGVTLRHKFQPSPAVQPERIVVRELGYLGQFQPWGITTDLRLFQEQVSRLYRTEDMPSPIPSAIPLKPADQFFSDGLATVRGAELSLLWRPQRASWVGLNYTRLDVKGGIDPATAAPPGQTPGAIRAIENSMPPEAATLFLAWSPSSAWELSLSRHYVGRTSWLKTSREQTTPPYYRTDARIARRFSAGATRAEFAVVLSNGGDPHADFDPRQMTPRQLYASLALEF